MTIFQAIILGIVQGLTEFVPISSSAHLIVIPWIFGWSPPGLNFDIALHMGTLAALIWFFAADWLQIIRAGLASIAERKIGDNPNRRLAWLLVLGCIPGAIIGILAETQIDLFFHQSTSPQMLLIISAIIILLGIALFTVERAARQRRKLERLTLKDTLIIGFAQALAILPGVSRSGSTITGGLATGLQREDAARFSFLLAAPMLAGASLGSLLDIYSRVKTGAMTQSEIILFAVGFAAAAASGYLCIKFLLRFLQKNSTDIFVYYRWLFAIIIIIAVFLRG